MKLVRLSYLFSPGFGLDIFRFSLKFCIIFSSFLHPIMTQTWIGYFILAHVLSISPTSAHQVQTLWILYLCCLSDFCSWLVFHRIPTLWTFWRCEFFMCLLKFCKYLLEVDLYNNGESDLMDVPSYRLSVPLLLPFRTWWCFFSSQFSVLLL